MLIAVQPAPREPWVSWQRAALWVEDVGWIRRYFFRAVSDDRLLKDYSERRVVFNPHLFQGIQYKKVRIYKSHFVGHFWHFEWIYFTCQNGEWSVDNVWSRERPFWSKSTTGVEQTFQNSAQANQPVGCARVRSPSKVTGSGFPPWTDMRSLLRPSHAHFYI